jgi:methyltransferase family protein
VIAVDLSEGMLARARAKAEAMRLGNVEFRVGEMERLVLPSAVASRTIRIPMLPLSAICKRLCALGGRVGF